MKKDMSRKNNSILLIVLIVLAFILLIFLVTKLLSSFSSPETDNSDFDIAMISSDTFDNVEINNLLVPEFIGITSDGISLGTSTSVEVISDIFSSFAGCISEVLEEGVLSVSSEKQWREATASDDYLYIRFRNEYADMVIRLFTDEISEFVPQKTGVETSIYELILVPLDEELSITAYVRNLSGEIKKYTLMSPSSYITESELYTVSASYASSLSTFFFSEGTYSCAQYTEPVFSSSIMLQNLIISSGTSEMISNSKSKINALFSLFDMNEDKIRTTTTGEDNSVGYIDSKGVLYVRDSSFEYRSTSGGGVELRHFIGFKASDNPGLDDYIQAAANIAQTVRDIDPNFLGGEADLYLYDIYSQENEIGITFGYSYDNIEIITLIPAVKITFSDERLIEASIYTISVSEQNESTVLGVEWGFLTELDLIGSEAYDIRPVYRTDNKNSIITPEWAGKLK